jgi:hypothetical protein
MSGSSLRRQSQSALIVFYFFRLHIAISANSFMLTSHDLSTRALGAIDAPRRSSRKPVANPRVLSCLLTCSMRVCDLALFMQAWRCMHTVMGTVRVSGRIVWRPAHPYHHRRSMFAVDLCSCAHTIMFLAGIHLLETIIILSGTGARLHHLHHLQVLLLSCKRYLLLLMH